MSEDFDQQLEAAKCWAREAHEAGWLTESDITPLLALENRSPASLFEAGAHRPLVVAFFGGTGVGKSSLLNRLAGQAIARAGEERPTSREVSIYLHESLQIRQLPPGFPVDRVRVARHADESRRGVLWIDMPDIDSTESTNRELVADWLPHLDVLIYVVSPERYRDDKGWRLLREHVNEHAWLFVMNQWDRGQDPQLADFQKLLKQGGFAAPMLFKTDCREDVELRKPDEFAELQSAIQSLADNHLIEQLEQRALDARRLQLTETIEKYLARFGNASAYERLHTAWAAVWNEAGDGLLKGLEWPMSELARMFVRQDANPLSKALNLQEDKPVAVVANQATPSSVLWDDWAQMQLQDALDRLCAEADENRLAVAPLRLKVMRVTELAPKWMTNEAQRALRLALANPGNVAQRFLLKFTSLSAWLLPLGAMGWVSWQAVTAYYESGLSHSGFLGVDFVAHSALIVGLSWLVPFFISRQLKPSAERTARRGLRLGVNVGLAKIQTAVEAALENYATDCQGYSEVGRTLLTQESDNQPKARHELLDRLIPLS